MVAMVQNYEFREKLGFNEKKKKTNNESETIVSREIFTNASVCVFKNFWALQFLSFLETLTKTSY